MRLCLTLSALFLATACSHSATNNTNSATPAPALVAPTSVPAAKAHGNKAKAKAKVAASAHSLTCADGDDTRTLEIVAKGEGCVVEYTKQQQKKEIASAEHESEHCKEVLDKVRGHLEGAGFSCH